MTPTAFANRPVPPLIVVARGKGKVVDGGVGVLETAQAFLDRRAGQATPRDLLKFLRKARNEEPSEADRR
jgi:hypothetical protein